jgi:hypothetical protein
MKQIILYAALLSALTLAAIFSYRDARARAVIAQHERTIKEQRAMIERLAQQEAIAIHITNEFRSNAVLGKVFHGLMLKNAKNSATHANHRMHYPKIHHGMAAAIKRLCTTTLRRLLYAAAATYKYQLP